MDLKWKLVVLKKRLEIFLERFLMIGPKIDFCSAVTTGLIESRIFGFQSSKNWTEMVFELMTEKSCCKNNVVICLWQVAQWHSVIAVLKLAPRLLKQFHRSTDHLCFHYKAVLAVQKL